MINPYYFFDEKLKIGFKINLSNIVPNFPDIGIETRYINKIIKEMATFYARLINQNKFKYHILFSPSFYTINEEDQGSDETELFIN